ncbi:MAG: hypothetical protein ACKVKF_07480 [Rhodobacterales bacterium]|uniref:hypothetical protein n=1 Tax=Puniceibacterium antarcticum TaxID=1206336 RepID=UPI00117B9A18|nr:hypothetical protein [Puniceibacterium antarcticum]
MTIEITQIAIACLPLVTPILSRCLVHNNRYKVLNAPPNRSLDETAERHVPILAAPEARDVPRLHDLLSQNIATTVDAVPDLTAQMQRIRHEPPQQDHCRYWIVWRLRIGDWRI